MGEGGGGLAGVGGGIAGRAPRGAGSAGPRPAKPPGRSIASVLAQVYPHGSTDSLPYCTMGSGSLNAMAVFEAGYRDGLDEQEAIDLVARAIRCVPGEGVLGSMWGGFAGGLHRA